MLLAIWQGESVAVYLSAEVCHDRQEDQRQIHVFSPCTTLVPEVQYDFEQHSQSDSRKTPFSLA